MAVVPRLSTLHRSICSTSDLLSKFEQLTLSSSLHPNEQHAKDKKKLLLQTSQLSHKILGCVSAAFPLQDSPLKLSQIKDEEKALQFLVKDLSKSFDRLNSNTLSALNLESPAHKQLKKSPSSIIDTLNLEIKKAELNLELNRLGFNPLSTPKERQTDLETRVSFAYSYVTTPLEHLVYARGKLNNESTVSMPKNTRQFVQQALTGCSIKPKDELAKGACATIHLAQIGNKRFAVKNPLKTNKTLERYFKTETSLYMTLKHPNIVEVKALSSEGLYLELMNDGNLWNIIESSTLKPDEVRKYLLDMIEGLIYVHEAGYTHRDLKPDNVLVSKKSTRAKLCDFGLTTLTKGDTSQVGSSLYVAPEILYNTAAATVPPISNKADIWSLGVIMFEMITGGIHPYPLLCATESSISYCQRLNKRLHKPCNEKDIFKTVDAYKPTKKLMKQRDPTGIIRSLIVKCLHGDPTQRITLQEIKRALIPPKKQGLFSFLS